MAIPADFDFREAVAADAPAIGRVVADAFEGYRSFAPEGWVPPTVGDEVEHLAPLLGTADFWCTVAERDGRVVANCAFQSARTSMAPSEEGELAHLRELFVDPEWWGCGLAGTLHAMALEEATARGFKAMRLFTPAGQARARRFYEREGWAAAGEPFFQEALGLTLIEYRRPLAR